MERIDSLEEALEAVEDGYFDLRLTGKGQDWLRWERRLYAKLGYLARQVSATDHRPTDQHLEVYEKLQADLAALETRYEELLATELADFEALLEERGIPRILTGSAPEDP